MNQSVIVGTVGRPHGLRGEVTVRPRTDDVAERFAVGSTLTVDGRPASVASLSWIQGRLVIGLVGVADRAGAEALRGAEVWAEVDPTELDDGEYHDTTLIGMAVEDPSGARLGVVARVDHPPAQDLLVVRTPAGERLVPFVAALVPSVDLATRVVVVNPIPGLFDEVPDED